MILFNFLFASENTRETNITTVEGPESCHHPDSHGDHVLLLPPAQVLCVVVELPDHVVQVGDERVRGC